MTLPGRDAVEALTLAILPYLDGISGEEEAARKLVEECSIDGKVSLDALLSLVVLRAGAMASAGALASIYGDTYTLEREGITDLHALAAVVDACGRAGRGGLAASILLSRRAPGAEAWEALRSYRARVIAAIRSAEPLDRDGWYGIGDASVNGPVADALALSGGGETPVFVFAPGEGVWHISGRCPEGVRMDLEAILHDLARSCDGDGGGHRCRAGATISPRHLDQFRKSLAEAVGS
jgi:single-stranded-DNA-specific exonuclease